MGRRERALGVALPLVFVLGCYSTGEGPEPPTSSLYFPSALAVSPGGNALYVANSDFDLQFNSGTVEVLDLGRIREALRPIWGATQPIDRSVCQSAGLDANANTILYPGPCSALDLGSPPDQAAHPGEPLVRGQAKIGAFATDMLFVCMPDQFGSRSGASCPEGTNADPDGKARLFVPVRGEPSLTYFDVEDDRGKTESTFQFDCGQRSNDGHCDPSHRPGSDPNDNSRDITLPTEPYGVAVTGGAEALVVSHQTTGTVSLFTVTEGTPGTSVVAGQPRLQFTLSGLPAGALGLAAIPVPALFRQSPDYQPGFLVGYTNAPEIDTLRYFDDGRSCLSGPPCEQRASGTRPFLTRAAAIGLSASIFGSHSRGIAIDDSARRGCEKDCDAASKECLAGCATLPVPVYVANRQPPTLLVGETRVASSSLVALEAASATNELVSFYDTVPLSVGASRLVVGRIKDRMGALRTRVFIVCFDSRVIFVYDPEARRIEGEIRTGRGPQPIVMDPNPAMFPLAYVGHFTDSYIGVVDLDQSHADTFESMVASIGVPQPPQESK
jgi:DNA-binding beta-propeller fold protein YncE